ncbi:MAG: hypothetical protein P8M18_02845 [Woeseiaceae bacterium]|nr:hypothetical protein [Woeseiaceae bacterium]
MSDATELQSGYLGCLNPAQRQKTGGFAAGPLLVIADSGKYWFVTVA